jgi:hypothetical protein
VLNRVVGQRRIGRFGIKQDTVVGFFGKRGMGVFRGVINAIYLLFTAKAGTSLVWSVPKGRKKKVVQACAFLWVGRLAGLQQLLKPILLLGAVNQFYS